MRLDVIAWICACAISFQDFGHCLPTSGEDLSSCQTNYKSVVARINGAADGVSATVWRLFFHNMDLDGNGHLAASELTLYLESKGQVHQTDIMEVMREAEAWMKFGDAINGEISTKEFKNAVEKSMVQKIARNELPYHIALSVCKIFNSDVPHLIESLSNLESCTKSLEASVHDDGTGGDFNTWYAIFETLDSNKDDKIGFEELKRSSSVDDVFIASALGHAIYGNVQHGVKDITESNFYVFVHELLYGITGSHREHSWSDVYDETELKGREMLCNVIYDVRKTLNGQRDVMSDCVKSYKATKERILGADGVFAPEIVFTMADLNRDGKISQEEFDSFIGTPSSLYSAIRRQHAGKAMRIDDFRAIMPDKMGSPKEGGGVTSKLALTSMTSSKLSEAEMLCHAIIASVQKYPTQNGHIAIDYMSFKGPGQYMDLPPPEHTPEPSPATPTAEVLHVTDHNGDPIEIEIRHPPPHEESSHGNEHHAPQFDIGITPPSPTHGSQNSETMIYHMYDNDGNPIEIHISANQINEIVHEMSHPPSQSRNKTESPPSTTPAKATTSPSVEEDEGLKSEISQILNKRIKEETEEELRLKKLLASLENGETHQE